MKKTVLALLASFLFANASYAQFEGPAANNSVITVKQALDLSDNARVALRGHITKSLGDEKYTFTDGTAEVMIEIDDEDWGGRKVTPESTVEIFGELDKEMFEPTKIDVDSFNIQ
ncbi:MAG: NirD/YgiW/YdeI family stress tolerance protein [Alphaproteobacteria bacterium]|nr:NirD/YgiW/YdeI family stress tolerance protein [Alphaproteobacteria bacterium]